MKILPGMKIRTTQHFAGEWVAIDEATYDGPESPLGYGDTEREAIADLIRRITDRMRETSRRHAANRLMTEGRVR